MVCGVQCIEAYMDKMVECLVFLCECNELTLEEKAQFLKKVRQPLHMGPVGLVIAMGSDVGYRLSSHVYLSGLSIIHGCL